MAASANDTDQREALLDAWVEKRRDIAILEAEASALLSDRLRLLDDDVREHPQHRESIHRSTVAEYSAAGRMSKGSVEYAFTDALFLDAEHPMVRDAFRRGAISAAHVREIVREGSIVRQGVREGRSDADTLALDDTAAIVVAEHDSPARTRTTVRQIASSLAGETVVELHRRAHRERSVTLRSLDDGLALLQVVLPEHLAHAILDRLTRLAQHVIDTRDDRTPGAGAVTKLRPDELDSCADHLPPHGQAADDTRFDAHVIFGNGVTFTTDPSVDGAHVPTDGRGIDAIRTDLLSDLLLTTDPSAARGTALESIQARLQVTIAAETLVGADDRPAELDGIGALHPDVARDLAGRHGGWSRLFLDRTGIVTATAAYAPTAAMRRHLQARDQHCRFPGCRTPIHRCQIDHNHDHAKGGRTSIDNLSHFCVGHHSLKHPGIVEKHRWHARQLPGGDIEWTSPLGRVYTDAPPRRVMFISR
ncbi:DUF222 domain-containing protein [Microbacterium sp. NPDC091662]|uniref:HNH endonuclease signature motif containing protein n=1 Tax=Microbacterium sp. NPDC091662 TaxID=3364211 RepID=UPI0037F4272E